MTSWTFIYWNKIDACEATQTAHTASQLAIDEDRPERIYQYWLLVWPEGTILDNYILSGHATDVTMTLVPMESKANTNCFDKKILGLAIYWKIAEKYSGRQVEAAEDDVDPKKLFG